MGVKTRRAYQTWLKANNYPPEKALSDARVADLRQQAQEKKARRVAKAKAEREENARKLAVASRKRTEAEAREVALHARLSTQADALMADVQGFLAADPGIKNILEVSIAFSDLEAALGEKQGRKSSGAVRKSMDQLKKLVTKNKTFRTFLAKKEEARKMAELSAFALSTAKLESFHKFLKVYLAKNLGSKSARRLIPVIKEIKATLGAPTKTNLDELSAKVASLINTTPNLRKAFANQKSAVEIAAARVASEVKRKSDADKKLKAEAAAKAKADRKRRLAMAKGKRRRALEKKHKHAIAVIIGNRNYSGSVPEVSFAHNDADAVRKFVVEKLGYRTGNVIDIRDASQARMMALFGTADTHKGELYSYVRPGKSDVTVFYSGHGVPGLEDRRGYLLPVDANPNLVEINGYPVDLLFSNLTKINAKSTTVYLDACFSGDSPKGMLVRAASGLTVTPTMPAKMPGMIVITAAKGNQFASWDEDAKLGLFTKHLLIALNGLADNEDYGNGDGRISLSEVRTYLDEEMTYQARRRYNREQQVSVQGDLGVVLVDNETR